MRKVELATPGSWAKIRDAKELTVGGQRKIQQAVVRVSAEAQETMRRNEKRRKGTEPEPLVLTPADFEALNDANDACVLALVTEWSFDEEITPEGLQELPLQDYSKLQAICAPAVRTATVDFSPPDPKEVEVDPNTPFGSSSGSNGHSEEETSTVAFPITNSASISS
jgi:hypothetical protein